MGLPSHPRCLGKSRAPERYNDRADHPAVSPYVVHYHHKRTPQGLDNHLMAPGPEPNDQAWTLVRREHRGGLLLYSYREAASGSALFFHHTGVIRLLIVYGT